MNKKISRLALSLVVCLTLAIGFSGCTFASSHSSSASQSAVASVQSSDNQETTNSSKSASTSASVSASVQASNSSTSVSAQSTTKSGTSSAGTSNGTSSGVSNEFEVIVPEDDDSYAENHLVSQPYVAPNISVSKDGEYTDKDSVALYIHIYGKVPSNYITKTKARNAGWVAEKGNLASVLPGKSIGGGGFYNDDNMMPDARGREWFECDIDYQGGFRNAKRLVYSNDGLIYYTDDHYKTFQRVY